MTTDITVPSPLPTLPDGNFVGDGQVGPCASAPELTCWVYGPPPGLPETVTESTVMIEPPSIVSPPVSELDTMVYLLSVVIAMLQSLLHMLTGGAA